MTREEIERKNNQFRKERMAEQRDTICELYETIRELQSQLNNGRNYLMQVEEKSITVADALEAFGFGRNVYSNY